MSILTPYHEGELAVQDRAGQRDVGALNGSVISDTIIKGAQKFIEQQSFIVTGSTDHEHNVWASVIFGKSGFMSASDKTIEFDLSKTRVNSVDPFWSNIESSSKIGGLVIEMTRRRRLRVNGDISTVGENKLRLDVLESYPNCPKYVQRRTMSPTTDRKGIDAPTTRLEGTALTSDQRPWVETADTLFVASAHVHRGVDASHRGGKPGFVQVINDTKLLVPDYAGNGMFNTLGNFEADPRAGLLFIDFKGRRTLQLTGKASILWDLDVPDHETGGTRRYWEFEIYRSIQIDDPAAHVWEFVDSSPFNP